MHLRSEEKTRRLRKWAGAGLLSLIIASPVSAWGLKTHAWIARQVLSDVRSDGKVSIAGREYKVPAHVWSALRKTPESYVSGAFGPDAYPDPIAGQTTTHPGVTGGWQADDWLDWVASKVASREGSREIAFYYGLNAHFAGDIFAHSYVNAYAGGTFDLLDGEHDVERRHVALERFIDARMPPLEGGPITSIKQIAPPIEFLSESLILDPKLKDQYARPATPHLLAMNEIYRISGEIEKSLDDLEKPLAASMSALLQQQLPLKEAVTNAALRRNYATDQLRLARLGLQQLQREQHLKEQARDEAKELIRRRPEILTMAGTLQTQKDALVEVANLHSKTIGELDKAVRALEAPIKDATKAVSGVACLMLDPLDLFNCKEKRNDLIEAANKLVRQRNALILQWNAADLAYRNLQPEIEGVSNQIDALVKPLRKAETDIASGALDLAVEVSRTQVREQENALLKAERAAKEADAAYSAAAEAYAPFLLELRRATVSADSLSISRTIVGRWRKDMEVASRRYVEASADASLAMVTGENPLSPYGRWVSCSGTVFMGKPRQLGEAACFAGDQVGKLHAEMQKIYNKVPEPLRWLILPSREIERTLLKELEPSIDKARSAIERQLSERSPLFELIILVGRPDYTTRERLNEIFANDESKHELLTFDDAASMIERDAAISGDMVDPGRFAALKHSVTLAKLALLGKEELNRLIADLAPGYVSPLYGQQVYRLKPNETILSRSVRSLDGNQQWQAYGLPRPRSKGPLETPSELAFGRDGYSDPAVGLRIWTDPGLRNQVFAKLFPEPVAGALADLPALKSPRYPYPSCASHHFPMTQGIDGALLASDETCKVPTSQ